ncbi:hypothetical protein Bbelb_351100 [Branchiostoma belcheri]|nr:hypothetical protein Bbelb_351100 [Branchiostoma belcheri]
MPKHGLGQGIRVSQTVLSPQARFGTRAECPRPCPNMVWDKAIACPELTEWDKALVCPELCPVRHGSGQSPRVPNCAQSPGTVWDTRRVSQIMPRHETPEMNIIQHGLVARTITPAAVHGKVVHDENQLFITAFNILVESADEADVPAVCWPVRRQKGPRDSADSRSQILLEKFTAGRISGLAHPVLGERDRCQPVLTTGSGLGIVTTMFLLRLRHPLGPQVQK